MRRRKRLLKIAVLGLVALTGIALCRQIIAQKAVETVIKQTTGFPIRIESLQISPWESRFAAGGIQLFNPPEFSDRLFADVSRVYVDYEFGSLFCARAQITRADLDIREVVIVKNTNGHSNVEQLRGLSMRETEGRSVPRPFQIDTLNLQIGRVVTKEYNSDGSCKESARVLDMRVTFRNVTEKTDINRRIFYAVLRRVWFGGTGVPANRNVSANTRVPIGAGEAAFAKKSSD
jgi:hypothetical protein